MFVRGNFKFSVDELDRKIWELIEKYRQRGIFIGLPHLSKIPMYIIEIQFYGDIEMRPGATWSKSIWVSFSTEDKEFVDNVEDSEFLRDLEEIVSEYFNDYRGIWEINKWFVQPI